MFRKSFVCPSTRIVGSMIEKKLAFVQLYNSKNKHLYICTPLQLMREMWHKLETAWNELPVSAIQTQFNSTTNWVRAILAARDSSCFY